MLIVIYSICGFVMISCLIGIIVLLIFWRRHSDPIYAKKESAPISSDTSSVDYEKLLSALQAHVKEKSSQKSSNTSTINYEEIFSEYMASKSISPEFIDSLNSLNVNLKKEVLSALMVQIATESKQKQQSEQGNPLVTG